jgi:hypothetical protein
MNDMTDTTKSVETPVVSKTAYVFVVATLIGGAAIIGYGAGKGITRGIYWIKESRKSTSV